MNGWRRRASRRSRCLRHGRHPRPRDVAAHGPGSGGVGGMSTTRPPRRRTLVAGAEHRRCKFVSISPALLPTSPVACPGVLADHVRVICHCALHNYVADDNARSVDLVEQTEGRLDDHQATPRRQRPSPSSVGCASHRPRRRLSMRQDQHPAPRAAERPGEAPRPEQRSHPPERKAAGPNGRRRSRTTHTTGLPSGATRDAPAASPTASSANREPRACPAAVDRPARR